jgi:hypothetical protein
MKPTITEEPLIRLRNLTHPGMWQRLSLLEKIAVVQVCLGACTLLLLVVLVAR